MEIKQLKMSEIIENPDNPRRQLGDLVGLVGSINAIGLVEPIVVRELERGQYIIVSGARRFAACKKLKYLPTDTLPCIVRADDTNEALASIAENTAREDLSVDELATAVHRLEGLSMSDEEISAALAIPAGDVDHARVLAKASKTAKLKLKALAPNFRQFTLAESAALVKYAGDDTRAGELAEVIEYEPEQLLHVISRFEEADARTQLIADLRSSMNGIPEVAPFREWERPAAGVEPLHNLATGDGKTMTPACHKGCAYAGFLIGNIDGGYSSRGKDPAIVHYCMDWKSAGHKLLEKPKQVWPGVRSTGKGAPQSDEAAAQRRTVIANNKLWGPARSVREMWIGSFILQKELNQAAKLWVLNEILIDHTRLASPSFRGTVPGFEQSFVIVWSQLVTAREELLKQCTWRPQSYLQSLFDRYFRMLKVQGYPVSEIESLLIVDAKQAV